MRSLKFHSQVWLVIVFKIKSYISIINFNQNHSIDKINNIIDSNNNNNNKIYDNNNLN